MISYTHFSDPLKKHSAINENKNEQQEYHDKHLLSIPTKVLQGEGLGPGILNNRRKCPESAVPAMTDLLQGTEDLPAKKRRTKYFPIKIYMSSVLSSVC